MGGLKFYARTAYLGLAIRCGDSIASPDMVNVIEESSYYLAHKVPLPLSSVASNPPILSNSSPQPRSWAKPPISSLNNTMN